MYILIYLHNALKCKFDESCYNLPNITYKYNLRPTTICRLPTSRNETVQKNSRYRTLYKTIDGFYI